jgi:plasmid replication initiation protein
MSNEVVKYHNDLNTVVMRTWTSEEMNFFFAILTKAKEQGLKKLVFDTDELKQLASSSRKYRWEETVVSAVKKIGQLTYFEQSEKKFRVMTLFELLEVDLEKRIVEVKVSSNFDYILNKLETQFTRYELEEFTSIRSTYAKTMYRLLKQWRTVGKKEFAIDDLKRILDMPSSYKSSEIDRAVIKPIKEQLSPYFVSLKVKKIKSNKRGNPVLGYEFTWQKEVTEAYDPNKYDKPKAIAKKPSKKAAKKSNVPKWSNPDYVNLLDPKIIDMLIEFHESQGTLETPEAKAEIAQKKKEIEEGRAKLEAKKWELLGKLDKSSEPDVVPGQTDIYDFLGNDEQ